VQPLDLAPGVLEFEFRPLPGILQVAVLVGVEQAVEVEASRPLVFGLQNCLSVIQADPTDVPSERAVGTRQVLRGDAQSTVSSVDLLDQRLVVRCRLLSSDVRLAVPTALGQKPVKRPSYGVERVLILANLAASLALDILAPLAVRQSGCWPRAYPGPPLYCSEQGLGKENLLWPRTWRSLCWSA
jgi:hypothetical protein